MWDIDYRPLIWMAFFGLACAALLIVVGIPAAAWWAWHHVNVGLH